KREGEGAPRPGIRKRAAGWRLRGDVGPGCRPRAHASRKASWQLNVLADKILRVSAAEDAKGQLLARLVRAVGRTAAQHSALSQAIAQQLRIAQTDLECLAVLQDLGPASAGQLADVLGLTTGAVTGVVDRLVAAGFVVRESDPDDR